MSSHSECHATVPRLYFSEKGGGTVSAKSRIRLASALRKVTTGPLDSSDHIGTKTLLSLTVSSLSSSDGYILLEHLACVPSQHLALNLPFLNIAAFSLLLK